VLDGEADIDFADIDADRDAGVVLEPASDGSSARSTTSAGLVRWQFLGAVTPPGSARSRARRVHFALARAFSGKVVTGFP
jgi:hypothetical protein